MTPTSKPVSRVSLSTYRFGGKPRALVVKIGPGDVITLRERGRRYVADLPLDWCYRNAVRLRVDRERTEKRLARKASKADRA